MKKLAVCLALCGVLFLAGCAIPQLAETPTLPATATVTPSITASATPTVTSTPLPTVMLTPGLVRPASFEIQPSLPEGHPYVGNLLLENALRGDGQEVRVSMYDLQSGERLLFSEKYNIANAVSPDRTRFAVNNPWGRSYDIYSANGQLIKSIPWTGKGYGLADWLDNERIGILSYTDFRDGWAIIGPDTVTFINTITGERQEYPPDYPDLDLANQPLYHGKWGTAIFNPALTRVVYPLYWRFNLYSLTDKEVVAELPIASFHSKIVWSADSSYFIAADYNNFYRVSAEGEMEQLTDFEDSFDFNNSMISAYSLSPNERRIAFWLGIENTSEDVSDDFTLAILDLKSGAVEDTGILLGDPSSNDFRASVTPVWSPDSRSIVVSANMGPDSFDVLLVDVERQMAHKLPANWYPTGWLMPEKPEAVFPTRTSTPVPVATPTPQPVVSINMEIQPASPENLPYTGNLLLYDLDPNTGKSFLLYDLDSGDKNLVNQSFDYGFAISPDYTQFALGNSTKPNFDINILSANGEVVTVIEGQEDWGTFAGWVDDNQVGIALYEEDEDSPYYKYPPKIVIYHLQTGNTKLMTTDFPDVQGSWFTRLGNWGAAVFSPDLSRAVYSGVVASPHPEMNYTDGYILYSVVGKRKIVEIPASTDVIPIWAADGSFFIVRGNDEFYKVSADGKIENLTTLNPDYRFGEEESLVTLLDHFYSLSPDERYLAFWMTDYDENLAWQDTLFTLAVLDLETGELIDTCIPSGHSRTSGAFEFSFDFLPAPIWSSDGKSLVISANMRIEEPQSGAEMDEDGNKIPYSDSGGVTQDLVLVDLENMTAYQLPSDWIPIGWLLAEDE